MRFAEKIDKWLILITGILCISFAALFVKKTNIAGEAVAFYRIFFALIPVFLLFVFQKKSQNNFRNIFLCLAGGVFFGLEQAFWNESIRLSSATIPTLLVNLSSLWVGIIGEIVLNEKKYIYHWIGNIIALFGVAIVAQINNLANFRIDLNIIYALNASLLFALYLIITKTARAQLTTISVLFYSLIGSTVTLLILCKFKNTSLSGYNNETWFFLFCLALVTQVLGYLTINYALGYLEVSKASVFMLLQPLLTGIFAYLFIGERLSIDQVIGGTIVISGLAISLIKQTKNGEVSIN